MPTPPTFFIGLGGTGGEIVRLVREKVRYDIEVAEGQERANQLIDGRFQFFAYDTWNDGAKGDLSDVGGKLIITGNLLLDDLVPRQLRSPLDPFFHEWWPESYSQPGSMIDGAGQVRLKGKAAAYFNLLGDNAAGVTFLQRISQGIAQAHHVSVTEGGSNRIPVYLITTLCGGSGAGAFLLIAQYLRAILGAQILPIGVLLLPGMVAKVSPGEEGHIWANGHAALRELDLWMRQDPVDKEAYMPSMRFPGSGGVSLTGEQAPFDFCYLFDYQNVQRTQLGSFQEYLRLVADCLSLDLYSPITDAARGAFSNFFQDVSQLGGHGGTGRPQAYGSASVSTLVFPVDQVVDFLAMEYARLVLNDSFLSPQDSKIPAQEAVESFIRTQQLHDGDERVLSRKRLAAPIEGVAEPAPPPFRQRLTPIKDKGAVRSTVEQLMQQADTWVKGHSEIATLNLDGSADFGIAGIRPEAHGTFEAVLHELLSRADGNGFEVAGEFLRELEIAIDEEIRQLGLRLNGSGEKGTSTHRLGLIAELDEMLATPNTKNPGQALKTKEGQVKDLLEEFDVPFYRRPRVDEKKAAFAAWFDRYLRVKLDIMRTQKARDFLSDFRNNQLHRRLVSMELMERELRTVDRELGEEARRRLTASDSNDGQMTIEERVFSKPAWVRGKWLAEFKPDGEMARTTLVDPERGIISGLQRLSELSARNPTDKQMDAATAAAREGIKEALLAQGRSRFAREVAELSIWDGLAEEARASGEGEDITSLTSYIRHKIQLCVGRSFPWWLPDEVTVTVHHLQSIKRSIAAFNARGLVQFNELHGTTLSGAQMLGPELGVQAPLDIPDRYRIFFYVRNGGLPLFALNQQDLQKMTSAEEVWAGGKTTPLYTDARYMAYDSNQRRYRSTLPRIDTPSEDTSALYVLMMGLQFGFLRWGTQEEDGKEVPDKSRLEREIVVAGKFREWVDLYPRDQVRGIVAIYRRLRTDAKTQSELADGVTKTLAEFRTPEQVRDALAQATFMAFQEQRAAEATEKDSDTHKFWQRAYAMLEQRVETQSYAVAV